MAAITAATDTTSVADRTNTEWIDRVLRRAAQRPRIWQALAVVKDLTAGKSEVYTHNIYTGFVEATAHTDSDQVSAVELISADTNTTTAEYASASFLADRAVRLSLYDEAAVIMLANIDACMLKIDNLVHGVASDMTNAIGNNATNNTVSNFNLAYSTWKTTAFSSAMAPVMVMHPDAMRDLSADALANAAAIFGSVVGEQLHAATTSGGPNMGIMRSFAGMGLIESAGVEASDTTGWGNFIVSVGDADGALVVPVLKDIGVEAQRVGDRIGGWIVASMDVGCGIVEQAKALRFTTRT